MASKETKPKEKETTFIQRRFRKNKDSQDKRKSQLLEQETTTQNEQTQTKITEKTNNIERENKDFDMPQVTTKTDSAQELESTQKSTESELESGKNSDGNKSDSQSSQNSSTQELDTNLLDKADDDFFSEIQSKEKRSQSYSSKISPRRAPIRRAISNNTLQGTYSKSQRGWNNWGKGGVLRLKMRYGSLLLLCYSAHSPLGLFSVRLHQVLRLLLT